MEQPWSRLGMPKLTDMQHVNGLSIKIVLWLMATVSDFWLISVSFDLQLKHIKQSAAFSMMVEE